MRKFMYTHTCMYICKIKIYTWKKNVLENYSNKDIEADETKWNGGMLGYLWKRNNFQIMILKKGEKQKSKVAPLY